MINQEQILFTKKTKFTKFVKFVEYKSLSKMGGGVKTVFPPCTCHPYGLGWFCLIYII